MDHQNGEPPGQNAIAGGSRVVARARPGAILAREPRGRENPMKRSLHALIADGVVGGVLAGLVVALWFLAVDSLAGRPFHTPAALAGALTRQAIGPPTFRLVAAYSVVHFGVFAVLGIAMAGAIAALRTPPRLLFGVLFGLVAQEIAFYGGLFLSDASRVAVVPWPHVVAANVLSGFVLMWYLHRAARDQHPFGLSALRGHPLLTQGLITGLVGAGVVALWFFALDVAAGHPLRTPAALGAALLFGASNVAAIDMTFGLVAAYSVVHVAAFVMAGALFVAIAEQIERTPALMLVALMAMIVLDAVVGATLAPGLNVLTGETGAGKSMLVDALALLLGERASSDVVRPGAQKAVIEGAFELTSTALDRLAPPFTALGVEAEDGRVVLKREISGEGRSRAWINGSPATVGVLAQLGSLLVDLHGQHETEEHTSELQSHSNI